jgi:transposase
MWAEFTRPQYLRKGAALCKRRHRAEWTVIQPHLFYIARTGCQWRLLPREFPHYSEKF